MTKKEPVIDIQNVQKELKKGRESLQSSLFNLIVYSPNEDRAQELKTILQRVTEKFPCQIIHIEKNNHKNADEIKVDASKEKFGKAGAHVTCDLIHIVVTESQMERVPFIILQNIVADLPIYLIWGEDPTIANKTLEALQNISTRFIFNAAWAPHLQDFSKRMLPFLKNLKIESMDIAWGQLSGFRDLLALVFDSEQDIEVLRNCKKIHIHYCGEKKQNAVQAIYLQAFIAAQMGWELEAEDIRHHSQKALGYRYKKNDIAVVLQPDPKSDAPCGSITKFEVTAKDGSSYLIQSAKDPSKFILHVSSTETCEMPCTFALPDINRGFNFLKEIFYRTSGPHYYRALEMVSQVDWDK